MVWQPLRALVERHSDTDRPARPAVVTDNSGWSATGVSFILATFGGDTRRVLVPDSRQPLVGETVYVLRAGPEAHAPYLMLPLPDLQAVCAGNVYVSAHDVDGGHGGEWAILRVVLSTLAWTRRSVHPVSGTWDRRPLVGLGGRYLYTWGVNDGGSGSTLYRSDDAGLTWTAAGLTGCVYLDPHTMDTAAGDGQLYAVADDGAAIYVSLDYGLTWAFVWGPPPGGGVWYAATQTGPYNITAADTTRGGFLVALATSGTYADLNVYPPVLRGPFGPAGTVGGALYGNASVWVQRAGGDPHFRGAGSYWVSVAADGDALPDGGSLPGGGRSASRRFSASGSYLSIEGATGAVWYWDGYQQGDGTAGNNTFLAYRSAENHPGGLSGIGARDVALVLGAGDGAYPWPDLTTATCTFVALDDDDPAHARFAVKDTGASPILAAGAWRDAALTQQVDTGARYAASLGGVATLEVWRELDLAPGPVTPPAVASAPGSAKANTSAPSGWQAPAFDDSAWLATVAGSGPSGIDGAALVTADAGSSPTAYFRQPFTLGAGVTSATLHISANDAGVSPIYVNGTAFYTGSPMFTTYDLDITSAILPGATNLLAFGASAAVLGGSVTNVAYSVEAS